MKKLKLAIYLLTLVFALTGCKKDVHVKTISEIKQMNKSQKQKSQKNKKRVKKSENTKLTGTESSPVPEDETTDNEQENQTVTDKKVIVLDPGHSAVVATGTEPLGPGSSEQKAADASGTRGISSGVPEYELTLNISVQLKEVLEQRGYQVVLTRESNNVPISCVQRAEVANNLNADVYVRIHANGSEKRESAEVTLIIRPRRFGKTMGMGMLAHFLIYGPITGGYSMVLKLSTMKHCAVHG